MTKFTVKNNIGLIIFTASCFLVILGILALHGFRDYEATYQAETAHAERNAQKIASRVGATIGTIDFALQEGRIAFLDALALPVAQSPVNKTLERLLTRAPDAQSLRIVNAAGVFSHDASGILSRQTVGDLFYFRELKDAKKDKLITSQPLFSKVTQSWVVVVARRLNGPDGEFLGVIQSEIPAPTVERFLIDGSDTFMRSGLVHEGEGKVLASNMASFSPTYAGREVKSSELELLEAITSSVRVPGTAYSVMTVISSTDAMRSWALRSLFSAMAYFLIVLCAIMVGSQVKSRLDKIRRDAKDAEEEHEIVAQTAKTLIESMPMITWVSSPSGQLTVANKLYWDINVPREGRINAPLIAQPEWTSLKDWASKPNSQESWLTGKDGQNHIIEESRAPVLSNDKVVAVVGVARDLTQEREIEDRLRLSSTVFQHANDSMIVTDATNKILMVNPAFLKNYGYAEDEVLGKTPSILTSGQHEASFFANIWQEVEKHGHWSGEVRNKTKDGKLRDELLTIVAVKGANQQNPPTHYIGVLTVKIEEPVQIHEAPVHLRAVKI